MDDEDKALLKKQIGSKIKKMRVVKDLSRQAVADALKVSLANYGYIERGEIDVSVSRLAEIAEVFEASLDELMGVTEKNVFDFSHAHNEECHHWKVGFAASEKKELEHELEKTQLLLKERDKEVGYLKEENTHLKEMLEWVKTER